MGQFMTRSVDLRIHNDMADIGRVRDTLDDLGREYGIPAGPLMQLQVAIDEVVSNVVKYSWDDGARHEFLVRITVLLDRVDLEIFDDGRAFDPLQAPAPKAAPAGQRPRPGGLGIHMVKTLVDNFSYERIGSHNHTTISKMCKVGAEIQGTGND
jgi:anti-sigma regulatory factor (Ser/Thr protein kinase)